MSGRMRAFLCRALPVLAFCLALSGAARADYVLLQDGRTLFNVRVVDTVSTGTRPLRVIFNPQSFGYDYANDTPFLLRGKSDAFPVSDYVRTAEEVGKTGARRVVQERNWNNFVAPPRVVIPRFTPIPPTPVPTPAAESKVPVNVADGSLPLEERIQRQLDIFIREQTGLAEQLKLYARMGTLDTDEGKKRRLDLLQAQVQVLDKYYPTEDELVSRAREALLHQQEVVGEKGRFNFED